MYFSRTAKPLFRSTKRRASMGPTWASRDRQTTFVGMGTQDSPPSSVLYSGRAMAGTASISVAEPAITQPWLASTKLPPNWISPGIERTFQVVPPSEVTRSTTGDPDEEDQCAMPCRGSKNSGVSMLLTAVGVTGSGWTCQVTPPSRVTSRVPPPPEIQPVVREEKVIVDEPDHSAQGAYEVKT